MRLHRFFVGDALPDVGEYTLSSKEISHQVVRVFRLGVGDSIILFNGDGFDCVSKVCDADRNALRVTIIEKRKATNPPRFSVTLCQSIVKKDNCEWIAEKATELGVEIISFIVSDRSEKKGINLDRMHSIVREASEQCGRGTVPTVLGPTTLSDALMKASHPIVFDVSHVNISPALFKTYATKKDLTFFIGPEGGWSDNDREIFAKAQAQVVSLPGNVLRAETAAISVLALALLSE
jgi:16S rRNA (uracil1498-N3)-methyltransferase